MLLGGEGSGTGVEQEDQSAAVGSQASNNDS